METQQRRIRRHRSRVRHSLAITLVSWLVVALTTVSLKGFSLLGPYAFWMDESKSYRQTQDIGGPMDLSEGYRWNIPVLTYGFDDSFIQYFGSNGVAAVEDAIALINSLPPASQINPTNFPLQALQINYLASSEGLIDLKSETAFLLLQHLGLAEPQRYMFCLRDSVPTNGGFQDLVIQRNFDPFTFQSSSNVNGVAYTYFLWHDAGNADASELAIDPLASGHFPAVADGILQTGDFFSGLSQDDVGGLRYLYGTNNIKFETLPSGVRGVGIDPTVFVDGAQRPGVDKITFVRHSFNSISGQFVPMTNSFTDTYQSSGVAQTQQLERAIARPDFLFTAEDIRVDAPMVPHYSRTGTSNWINNASLNGNFGGAGPGNIEPAVTVAFNKLGQTFQAASPGSDDNFNGEPLSWGTFDGSPSAPIAHPVASTGNSGGAARLWVVSTSATNSFAWTLSGATNVAFLFQTSSNLLTWNSVTTNLNNGSITTFFQWFPAAQRRFYRVIPKE